MYKVPVFVILTTIFYFLFNVQPAKAVSVQEFFVNNTTPKEKTGYPIISDPTSLATYPAYSWTTGGLGETLHHGPIAAGGDSFISNKGESAANMGNKNRVFVDTFDWGVEPWEKSAHFLETGDTTSKMQWEYLNNKPSGVMKYFWERAADGQVIDSKFFTYQNRFHGKFTLQNINYFGISLRIKGSEGSDNISGSIDTSVPGQPIVVLYDAHSGYYLAFGSTKTDQSYVDTAYQNPRYDFDTSKTSTTNSTTYAGIRATSMPNSANWEMVFYMDRNQTTAVSGVRTGLNNTASDYTSAVNFWQNYLSDTKIDNNLTPLSEKEKYVSCVALNQLAANSYNQSYLAAGTPIWSGNFARDSAFAALGLYDWKPTFAKDVIRWFAQSGWPSLASYDEIDINGTGLAGEKPTDWGPTYMWVAGVIYEKSQDNSFANDIKPQLDNLYTWVQTRYNTTDKHIDVSSSHTHDYWDQYAPSGVINTSLIKYESEMDILWALALDKAALIWTATGDSNKAAWAKATSSSLKTSLTDYKTVDNGYYFAKKTDNSLYSDFISGPTNLTAADFMEDKNAFNYLKSHANDLSLTGIPWENIGSTTYKVGVSKLSDYQLWLAVNWGNLSRRWGDSEQYNHLLSLTQLGYVPASIRAENNDFKIGQHIENQSWGYGMMLRMIYNNKFVYPLLTNGPTSTAAQNKANISWDTGNNSSSKVEYGIGTSYGNSTNEIDTSPRVSSHNVELTNLATCQTYHYRTKSVDAYGTTTYSNDKTFKTSCPTESNPQSTNNNSSSNLTCSDQKPGAKTPWLYGALTKSKTSILLYYIKGDDPIESYALVYGRKPGEYIHGVPYIKKGDKDRMTFLVEKLDPNTKYYFRIYAKNGCATGDWSNEISATTSKNSSNSKSLYNSSCKVHVVGKGESLWRIAQLLLGSGIRYPEVIQANRIQFPTIINTVIQTGWKIMVGC